MTAVLRPTRVLLIALLALGLALPVLPADAQTATENDIAYEVLTDATNEPLSLEIAPDGRLIWAQRDGIIWVLTPQGAQIMAGALMPAGNLCAGCKPEPDYLARQPNRLGVGGLEEGGLHGILLHRDFAKNNTIFAYRSISGTRTQKAPGYFEGEFHLSSFVLDPVTNLIDPDSEKVLLKVPAEWDFCCHYGGDLDYLPDGTIVLTTGDDIDASAAGGYGPRDHRRFHTNGELTSANPADRRGKILRLNEDGSVPDGSVEGVAPNPFIGMEGYNPYIEDSPSNIHVGEKANVPGDGWIEFDPYVYSLGYKQPWRAVVNPESGDIYVSDVGPDAAAADPQRGPAGLEEINRVPYGGGTHAGWPRCMGPNIPYMDVNWATMAVGGPLDCSADALVARPKGSTDPAEVVKGMTPATIYYGRSPAAPWPVFGSGGVTSEPVAFYPASTSGPLRLPARYNNRMLVLEWSRNAIFSIGYDPASGDLNLDNADMWRVTAPQYSVNANTNNPYGTVSAQQSRLMAPADGKVGPDGAFYFLEYGAFYYAGANGRLSRIKCAGCAPSDPSLNYGLPVDGPVPTSPVRTGMSLPGAWLLGALGLGVPLAIRRRRLLV
jgi:aldose sugar dehydrogenase